MLILLHSSKAMRGEPSETRLRQPELMDRAKVLASYLQTLSSKELAKSMRLSAELAEKTHALLAAWTAAPGRLTPAVDAFIGDIYSGLQAPSFSKVDREHADKSLRILSGLYGVLRPLDGICPYRLEMGYRLPDLRYANLYKFWGDSIASQLPKGGPIVNLAAAEYADAVIPYLNVSRFVSPRFLTVNAKSGESSFVVVHAKIARGAFARWLIVNRIRKPTELPAFDDIGYKYSKALSTAEGPTFVAKEFGGTGLSIRLM